VDARLHRLQGKAKLVTDLLPLLQEFYAGKLAMQKKHQQAARRVAQYDANNTYQYVINREDVQLSWLSNAIASAGGTPPAEPDTPAMAGSTAADLFRSDANDAQAFVDAWKPRVEAMTNARHRGMLRVILGETLEQRRFFEQALAGRTDLLGRREKTLGPPRGEVLPARWIE
jgi:hypothetical protein